MSKVTPLAYRPTGAAVASGLPLRRIHQAIKDHDLPAHKAGRATLILADDLHEWLRSLPIRNPDVPARGAQ
jgi:excisionase family DNA binding protein